MLPEAQKIFRDSLLSPDVKECNEKNGWYKPNTDDKVREIISKCVSRTLASRARKEGGDKFDASVVDDEDIDEDVAAAAGDPLGEIVDEVMEEQDVEGEEELDEVLDLLDKIPMDDRS